MLPTDLVNLIKTYLYTNVNGNMLIAILDYYNRSQRFNQRWISTTDFDNLISKINNLVNNNNNIQIDLVRINRDNGTMIFHNTLSKDIKITNYTVLQVITLIFTIVTSWPDIHYINMYIFYKYHFYYKIEYSGRPKVESYWFVKDTN
jgi:hypothetical protein